MVIPAPAEVDTLVARIPRGKLATLATLRQSLAAQHGATIACPVTTGIFMGLVARAAQERKMMGAKRMTPWWRVQTTDGQLNPRTPSRLAEHRHRLEAEGFTIVRAGRSGLMVNSFERYLAKL
jgi:alkylated DNA nucleotide flippase Atl1